MINKYRLRFPDMSDDEIIEYRKNNFINFINVNIKKREEELVSNYILDKTFPDRKNSKTEELKAEILNLERQLALIEQGLEDQTYEEYKQEYMNQEPELTEEEKKIAELEAQLAALRGGKDE